MTVVFILGIIFYYLQQVAKTRGWCTYIKTTSGARQLGHDTTTPNAEDEGNEDRGGNANDWTYGEIL